MTHSCGNCEGVDPGSCALNLDRLAGEAAESVLGTAESVLADLIDQAECHNVPDWHPEDQGIYRHGEGSRTERLALVRAARIRRTLAALYLVGLS